MVILHRLVSTLRSVFLRRRLEREMQDEMAQHLARATARLLARGLTETEARRAARQEFGNLVYLQEQARDARGGRWIDDLRGDVRYALRALRRNPGFSLVALLTIALGIGGTTGVFTLADEVVLRPLAVHAPAELVVIKAELGAPDRLAAPSYPAFERIRVHNRSLDGVAGFNRDHVALIVDGRPEQVMGQLATGNYFELLGMKAHRGRLFFAADDRLDPAVAVISHRYWQHRFEGRADILGKVVHYDGRAFTIVGVAPPGFAGLEPTTPIDIWLPMTSVGFGLLADNTASWFDVVARVKPGFTTEQARSDVDAIYRNFRKDVGIADRGPVTVRLQSAEHGVSRTREQLARPILLVLGLVAAVLVIACANIANLLLARAAARQREIAIRTAIGAGRLRIVRQLLTEAMLLFALGSLAGVFIARIITRLLADFFAIGRLPIVLDLRLDLRALAFTAVVCLLAGLLAGLVPAIRAARGDTFADLRLRADTRRGLPVSRWLVALQVAISIVILVAGSLLVQSLRNLRSVNNGFRADGVLTMSVRDLAPDPTTGERDRLWTDVVSGVERIPGVHSASLSILTPLSGRDRARGIQVPGFQANSATDLEVRFNYVSPAYFETFGIQVLSGRAFEPIDVRNGRRVAILNETAARFYFGERNPIGRRIILDARKPIATTHEVVGVVADTKHRNLRDEAPRFLAVPLLQSYDDPARLSLAVKVSGDPLASLPLLLQRITALDRDLLVSDVMSMERQLDYSLLRERMLSALSIAFGSLGLLLAMIGLYGLIAYAVVRRRNEIGIRLALGASPASIRQAMLRDAVAMVASGMAIGLPLSLVASRALRSMLFGVSPADPVTIAGCLLLLAAVAGLAAYLPARRASRIAPTAALATE